MLRGHGKIGRQIIGRKLKVSVVDERTGRRNWSKVTERNKGELRRNCCQQEAVSKGYEAA